MADPVLQAQAVTKRFGGVAAVDDVSFDLARGEIVCLVGPNGAGKSTFFKCLFGIHRADEGRIRILGRDVSTASPDKIARLGVGIKPQQTSLMNDLSVGENLWLAVRRVTAQRAADARVEDVLEQMGLASIRDEITGTLAHGTRQRVELGMVMAPQPDVILLDEPAAGLSE